MTDQTTLYRVQINWTDTMKARVKTKWIGGLSLSTIARDINTEFRINATRNAVISLVRRNGWHELWPREAPKNITEARTNRDAKAARARLLDLPVKPERKPARPKPNAQRFHSAAPEIITKDRFVERENTIPQDAVIPKGHHVFSDDTLCLWPQVDPARDALKCEEVRADGWPYCDGHCRRGYVSFGTEYNRSTINWLSSAGSLKRTP